MANPASVSHATEPAFDAPSRRCDIVVKGGISGGITCPPLVLELARTYRFRSIGGTSAGAIAAALTAAAEYGRERGGFEKLRALNQWLEEGTHLRDLFQPTRATQPLLTLLLSLERRGRKEPAGSGAAGIVTRFWSWFPDWVRMVFVVIPGALRDAQPLRFWIATVLGGIVGGALDVLLARGLVGPDHPLARTVVAIVLPVMFIGSYVASVGACVWRLWRIALAEVPEQGFGTCTGLTSDAPSKTPALTDWLHQRIQDLAGLPETGPPLTVGMLSAKRLEGGDARSGIELRMITTALNPGKSFEHTRPEDMPVLVLARMSMNFPILPSAVPLSLPEFIAAIWGTIQNPSDRVLVALPGNGESIVQIGLASDERDLDLAIGHHIMHKDDAAGR